MMMCTLHIKRCAHLTQHSAFTHTPPLSFASRLRPVPAQYEEYPEVGAKKGVLMELAAEIVEAWETRQLASIKATKTALAGRGANIRNFFEKKRFQALIADSMMRSHDTFSAFLAPPTLPVMRWQRWLVIFTLILTVLTVDIWLYWNRGFQCWCARARVRGCDVEVD